MIVARLPGVGRGDLSVGLPVGRRPEAPSGHDLVEAVDRLPLSGVQLVAGPGTHRIPVTPVCPLLPPLLLLASALLGLASPFALRRHIERRHRRQRAPGHLGLPKAGAATNVAAKTVVDLIVMNMPFLYRDLLKHPSRQSKRRTLARLPHHGSTPLQEIRRHDSHFEEQAARFDPPPDVVQLSLGRIR